MIALNHSPSHPNLSLILMGELNLKVNMCTVCIKSYQRIGMVRSSLPCAERVDYDGNWRVVRGSSMILQQFQDEIAPAKHKAAKTLVHRLEWHQYGDRLMEDSAKSAYAGQLMSFVKQLLADLKGEDRNLSKVGRL